MRIKGDKTIKLSYDFNMMVARPKPRECFLKSYRGCERDQRVSMGFDPFLVWNWVKISTIRVKEKKFLKEDKVLFSMVQSLFSFYFILLFIFYLLIFFIHHLRTAAGLRVREITWSHLISLYQRPNFPGVRYLSGLLRECSGKLYSIIRNAWVFLDILLHGGIDLYFVVQSKHGVR